LSVSNIVLIGFMGSGKSTIGRLLAKEREAYFLDTDSMIESLEGKSITGIFNDSGEAYFRTLENETVHWLKNNVDNAIISAGGGMLVYCKELKEVGKIIYLEVPFEIILSRMNSSELDKRPLFKSVAEAEKIYNERVAIYRDKADIIIDASQVMQTVLSKLRGETV
jgi:shikimate kinase